MGLSKEPHDAVAFYSAVAASGMLGIGLTLSPLDPIKALYWSAVINGVVAVPVMIVIMLMTGEKRVMGKFVIGGWLRWLGWASTTAMTICVGAMLYRGLKLILVSLIGTGSNANWSSSLLRETLLIL